MDTYDDFLRIIFPMAVRDVPRAHGANKTPLSVKHINLKTYQLKDVLTGASSDPSAHQISINQSPLQLLASEVANNGWGSLQHSKKKKIAGY